METALEIIKFILPSVVVFITAYYLISLFFENEAKKNMIHLKHDGQKVAIPLRIQAYERMALYMERITPENLVMRVIQPTWSVPQLQIELLNIIQNEYEHNMSQQVFVSDEVWILVRKAKEEVVKMINIAVSQLPQNASASDLSQKILEISGSIEKQPTHIALDFLKKEVRNLY